MGLESGSAMGLESDERVIVAKHGGRCRLCKAVFAAGTEILWSPTLGTRCVESDQVDGADQCVGLHFDANDCVEDFF